MEKMNILTSQKEKIITWKKGFVAQSTDEGTYFCAEQVYFTAEEYCQYVGLDYRTVGKLGRVTYLITYHKVTDNDSIEYVLRCATYIDNLEDERLSFELFDSVDWLGLFEEKTEIGKAQWLPSNWKELMSDEQKEEIAREWCKDNSCELEDFLSDSDKADIAYNYIDDNTSDCVDRAYDSLGDYEKREFIKDCIDNL